MEIKKENNKSVLDLDLKIKDKKVSISLYDKRDNFLFYIVREPYLCSNIPLKIFYLALGTEIYKQSELLINAMNLELLVGKTMVPKRTPPKYFAGFF